MPTAHSVGYSIEVVGTRVADLVKDEKQWLKYLGAAWKAIGESTVKHVQDEISLVRFKNSTGRLQRAVAWESSDYSLIVYMDPLIAPHAAYQEFGVRPHVMRYLLGRTVPIPTGEKSGGKYATTVLRTATNRWMGVPHPYVDQRGQPRMATGWMHPGYEGKKFFRKGVDATLEEATKHIKGLAFKLTEMKSEE